MLFARAVLAPVCVLRQRKIKLDLYDTAYSEKKLFKYIKRTFGLNKIGLDVVEIKSHRYRNGRTKTIQ